MSHGLPALMGAAAAVIVVATPLSMARQAHRAERSPRPPRSLGASGISGHLDERHRDAARTSDEFAGREFLTGAEAVAYEKRARERNDADRRETDAEADLATGYNDLFWDRGTNRGLYAANLARGRSARRENSFA